MPGNVDAIQKIIDDALAGDTILFKGSKYTHLYLTINKALNIISDVGTTLISCPSSSGNPFIFSITEEGSGTNITGFNLSAKDGHDAIKIENASNINIIKNIISGNGNGIGLYGNNSNIEIKDNNISNNRDFGIYFGGTVDNIQNNIRILYNYIETQGKSGIYINSSFNNLAILSNMINGNGKSGGIGNGIYMDSGTNTSLQPDIRYNYIMNNEGFNAFQIQRVGSDDDNRALLNIGYNFYGTNSKSGAGLCSKTTTGIILTEFEEISKGMYKLSYKTNDTKEIITQMIPHYIKVCLNDNTQYKNVLVKNGVGIIDFRESSFKSSNNKIYTWYKNEQSLQISNTHLPQKSVKISSKINSPSIKLGATTKYIITIKNNGEKILRDLNIAKITPKFSVSSFNLNKGAYNKNTGKWIISSLKAGETATLNIILKPNKIGTYKSTATLSSSGLSKKSNTVSLKVKENSVIKYKNYVYPKKIKKNKYTILKTVIKNSGTKSKYIKVKIGLSKGLKVSSTNYKKNYSKKTKQWKIKIPAKKTIKLKMKVKGTRKGTKKVLFNVNGKKQTQKIKVV